MTMSRDEAQVLAVKILEGVDAKLEQVADLAKTYNLFVSWEGPSYGMGGYADVDGWESSSTGC